LRMDSQKLSHDDCSTMPIVRSTSTCRVLVLCLLRLENRLPNRRLNTSHKRFPLSGRRVRGDKLHNRPETPFFSGHLWNLLACVKRELLGFGPKFWFEAPQGAKLGEVQGKILSVRPTFEIYDASNRLVAVVKKKLFSLLGSQWWMEDSSGHEIAKVSGNIWEHDYRVETPADAQIAQIHKKWISVRDSYCVEITNPEIKPFLVLSYVIAMDHVEDKEHGKVFGRPVIRF